MSGFGISRGSANNFFLLQEVWKVFSRLKKLYFNYWKVFAIFIPLGFVLGKLNFSLKELILNFLGWSHSYNIEWWVIRKYSLIILTTPVLTFFFRRVPLKKRIAVEGLSLAVVAVIKVLSLYYPLFGKLSNGIDAILPWYMIFFIGYIVAEHRIFETMEQWLSTMKMGVGYAWIILILSVWARCAICKDWNDLYQDVIIAPLFTFSVWYLYIHSSNRLVKFSIRLHSYLGKNSMFIWLIHTFLAYYYFGDFIYSFKYSVLIFTLCMLISCLCASAITGFFNWCGENGNKMRIRIMHY